jgi:multiple sugar transport system permease protein
MSTNSVKAKKEKKKFRGIKLRRTPPEHTLKEIFRSPVDRADFLRSIAFLAPSVLGVLVFFIVPFGVVVYYSIIESPVNHEFVFLDNFIRVIQNSSFQIAVKNTVMFSVAAVPLAVVLSLGLALLLECKIPMKSQFRTFFLSPMMVPIASVVLIWQVLFHYNGSVNAFLALFGVDKIDWLKSEYCLVVITILFLWKNLGYNMILFMAALNNIPRELLEVADVEGASKIHQFFHIKLRYLSPTVLFVTILSLINSFKVFREIYLLTGDYPYEGLYMLQHFMNNTFRSLDYQKLSAAAVLMALVMVALIALLFVIEDRFGKDVEG